MKIDCVFSGGGIKGISFIGALQSIEESNLQIERVAGVSAGAIIGAFLMAGYTSSEIFDLVYEKDMKEFLDVPLLTKIFPFTKWYFLYDRLGMYKGERLEEWIFTQLAEKDIYTFADIPDGSLKMIVSDLTLEKLIVIPDDLERIYGINAAQFSVAKAVRMSASFPYFFMPKRIVSTTKQESVIVDGGLVSNFPVWLFHTRRKTFKRPVLGIHIKNEGESDDPPKITNALSMLQALFSTMKGAHDDRYISLAASENILTIPVEDVPTMDLEISQQVKWELFTQGYERTTEFLRSWPT